MLGAHSAQLFQLCSRELPCVGSPWGSRPTQHSPLLGSGTLCRETDLGKNGHGFNLDPYQTVFFSLFRIGVGRGRVPSSGLSSLWSQGPLDKSEEGGLAEKLGP